MFIFAHKAAQSRASNAKLLCVSFHLSNIYYGATIDFYRNGVKRGVKR